MKYITKKEADKIFDLSEKEPRTVCICGSTKFKDDIIKIAREQTLANRIVVMPLVFAHQGDTITEEQKTNLDNLHRWKIRNSSLVIAVCQDMYIGESTIKEIIYANMLGTTIQVYNNGSFAFGFGAYKKFSQMIHLFSERSQEIYKRIVSENSILG